LGTRKNVCSRGKLEDVGRKGEKEPAPGKRGIRVFSMEMVVREERGGGAAKTGGE